MVQLTSDGFDLHPLSGAGAVLVNCAIGDRHYVAFDGLLVENVVLIETLLSYRLIKKSSGAGQKTGYRLSDNAYKFLEKFKNLPVLELAEEERSSVFHVKSLIQYFYLAPVKKDNTASFSSLEYLGLIKFNEGSHTTLLETWSLLDKGLEFIRHCLDTFPATFVGDSVFESLEYKRYLATHIPKRHWASILPSLEREDAKYYSKLLKTPESSSLYGNWLDATNIEQ